MTPTDDDIDLLLARGKLGREQRERILGDARDAAGPASRARPRRWAFAAAGALAFTMGAAVIVLRPHAPELRQKGAVGALPLVEVTCLESSLKACPRGSLIAFSV